MSIGRDFISVRMVGHPWPVAGGRWPVAGGRWPVAGGRWPVAGAVLVVGFDAAGSDGLTIRLAGSRLG